MLLSVKVLVTVASLCPVAFAANCAAGTFCNTPVASSDTTSLLQIEEGKVLHQSLNKLSSQCPAHGGLLDDETSLLQVNEAVKLGSKHSIDGSVKVTRMIAAGTHIYHGTPVGQFINPSLNEQAKAAVGESTDPMAGMRWIMHHQALVAQAGAWLSAQQQKEADNDKKEYDDKTEYDVNLPTDFPRSPSWFTLTLPPGGSDLAIHVPMTRMCEKAEGSSQPFYLKDYTLTQNAEVEVFATAGAVYGKSFGLLKQDQIAKAWCKDHQQSSGYLINKDAVSEQEELIFCKADDQHLMLHPSEEGTLSKEGNNIFLSIRLNGRHARFQVDCNDQLHTFKEIVADQGSEDTADHLSEEAKE